MILWITAHVAFQQAVEPAFGKLQVQFCEPFHYFCYCLSFGYGYPALFDNVAGIHAVVDSEK